MCSCIFCFYNTQHTKKVYILHVLPVVCTVLLPVTCSRRLAKRGEMNCVVKLSNSFHLFMGHGVAAAINNKTTFVFDVAPQFPPIAQPQHRPFNFTHPPRRMVPRPGHCFQTMQPRPQAKFLQRQLHIMQRFLQVPNHESMGWQWGMHVFFREANNTTTKKTF